MSHLVVMRVLKPFRQYNAGERIGVTSAHAERLEADGVAQRESTKSEARETVESEAEPETEGAEETEPQGTGKPWKGKRARFTRREGSLDMTYEGVIDHVPRSGQIRVLIDDSIPEYVDREDLVVLE